MGSLQNSIFGASGLCCLLLSWAKVPFTRAFSCGLPQPCPWPVAVFPTGPSMSRSLGGGRGAERVAVFPTGPSTLRLAVKNAVATA